MADEKTEQLTDEEAKQLAIALKSFIGTHLPPEKLEELRQQFRKIHDQTEPAMEQIAAQQQALKQIATQQRALKPMFERIYRYFQGVL